MRKISLLTACLLSTILLAAQPAGYWQQQVDYTIDVSLNDKEHTLDGFAKIIYTNHSPDTLRFIWFHIWPNAYKNDRTAFSDQLLENGDTRFYFSEKEKKGYINRLAFEANGTVAATEDHPQHIDIIKVLLPAPLAPGDKAVITTPFHVKLPYNFSRGGHIGESYQITQWYPKPAVYDKDGWQPMPYLEQGEFYSEFGNYDVSITLPANYVVAATGILQDEAEAAWLKQRSNFDWKPVKEKKKMKGGNYKIIT
ncbi:MAG TPA: M1 family peptidase, partial [Chitinophagaceae bacterium]|nr:M1 family peptidase [Chitinophagaceae bacterium]